MQTTFKRYGRHGRLAPYDRSICQRHLLGTLLLLNLLPFSSLNS